MTVISTVSKHAAVGLGAKNPEWKYDTNAITLYYM